MKKQIKRLALLVTVIMLVQAIFVGVFTVNASAATLTGTATGYTEASDVQYVTSGNYVLNWGAREEDATFLTTYALNFYTGNDAFDVVSQYAGGTSQSDAPSSALYLVLQEIMVSAHTTQTSYGETRYQYMYTDCVNSNSNYISSFYSGTQLNSAWDAGATWNREHSWPKSKTQYTSVSNSSINEATDIMSLRPTASSENSSRNNKAYGTTTSTSFFNPNHFANGQVDVRGDVARLCLYVYVRWGNVSYMWGSSGVMQSLDVLLTWMEEDPVDTWEMGRNDAVQAITGTRNVFIDYPEYAFLLFGEEVPTDMVTPSGKAAEGVTAGTNTDTSGIGSGGSQGGSTVTYTTGKAALDELYALSSGSSKTGNYKITGKITALDSYNNPTIVVAGYENMPVYCYKLVHDDFAVGKTITVTSTQIKNYSGTYEFMNCTLVSFDEDTTGGGSGGGSGSSGTTSSITPVKPVVGTAYKLGMHQEMASKVVYLIGEYAQTYYVGTTETKSSGLDFYIEETTGGYYIYTTINGAKQYLDMVATADGAHVNAKYVSSPSIVYTWNDTEKTFVGSVNGEDYVFGTRNDNTYTTVGCNKLSYEPFTVQFVATGNTDTDNPGTDPTPTPTPTPSVSITPVKPVAGTAYKLGMAHAGAGKVVYMIGTYEATYYIGSTETKASGLDFYVEETTGGYYIYTTINGAKQYLDMVPSGEHVNAKYVSTPSVVYTWNDTAKTLTGMVNGSEYVFGTRSDKTYTTVGCYQLSGSPVTIQFVATEGGSTPDDPGTNPDNPTPPAGNTNGLADAVKPEAGKDYKLAMNQVLAGKVVYLLGEESGYYLATSANKDQGLIFNIEETTGGYYIYTMINGAKKYLDMVPSADGAHVNAKYVDTPSTVYTWNETYKTFVGNVGGDEYAFGTRNDKNYETVGCNKLSYEPFVLQFLAIEENNPGGGDHGGGAGNQGSSGNNTPTQPTTPDDTADTKSGCGSTIGGISAIVIALVLPFIFFKKKDEDEE